MTTVWLKYRFILNPLIVMTIFLFLVLFLFLVPEQTISTEQNIPIYFILWNPLLT